MSSDLSAVASCGGDAAGPLVGAGAGGDSGGVGAEGARTTQAAAPSAGPGAAACREQPWVVRWVDYSTKYGLGYLLSDGTVGVVFNDSSRIALPPGRQAVCYWERRGNGASCDPPARVLPLSEPLVSLDMPRDRPAALAPRPALQSPCVPALAARRARPEQEGDAAVALREVPLSQGREGPGACGEGRGRRRGGGRACGAGACRACFAGHGRLFAHEEVAEDQARDHLPPERQGHPGGLREGH